MDKIKPSTLSQPILKSIEDRDIAQLWSVIESYKNELRPWLDWVDRVQNLDAYRTYMEQVKYEESIGIQKAYVVCIEDRAVGEIAFEDFDASTRSCGMGYWISPQYQQQGIMTEACTQGINKAFASLNIDKINIRFISTNKASFALAKKLGFTLDGVLRKNLLYHGQLEDEAVMSCFRHEWKF